MRSPWNSTSASIIALPEESLYEELKPHILEWMQEGLLSPFVFLTPECVTSSSSGPPRVEARILGIDALGSIIELSEDLFELLATQEFEVVRVVAVRALTKDSVIDSKDNKVLAEIVDYVTKTLPQAGSSATELDVGTRLLTINLVVAPSELHASNFHQAFEGIWSMHVVASPEDRSTPWTPDALVLDDSRFRKFILMHLVTTAGLWNGLAHSPFELVSREKINSGGIWLARVFVSAILTDGLSRRVAAKAINAIAVATNDLYDSKIAIKVSGTEVIPEELVDTWVDWMVKHVFAFEDATLSFVSPEEGEKPGKERWYEWTQIKHFVLFAWDKIKYIPWWIWVWIRKSVGRSLTRTFQGSEGIAEIGIDQNEPLDRRDRELALKLLEIKQATTEAKKALKAPMQRRSAKSTPKLWSNIRRLVFAMMDGSDVQYIVDMGLDSKQSSPVFARTGQIIQDPSEKFSFEEEFAKEIGVEQLSWKNLDTTDSIVEKYERKIEALKQEMSSTLDELVTVESEIDTVRWERGLS